MVYVAWTCAGVHLGVYLTLYAELSAVQKQSRGLQSVALFAVAYLLTAV